MKFDTLLVSTKFAPPRLGARSIPRKQLLDQLREMRHGSLALVTGSAGFGKTILLAQWRQELMKAGAEVAWLSLSSDDRQLASFWAYLLATLQRLGIPVEDDMLLEGGGGSSLDAIVAAVVGGAAGLGRELYLIVDDYHHVGDPWAHRLMQRLLDHCPANLHIAIASRTAPPLSVSRARLQGLLVEIECAELPFDLDETRLFFEQNLGALKLSIDELRLTHDLTGGWPASLQLIAIMLRGRPEARLMLRDLAWKSSDLQTYLAEDVLAHLPPELSSFMEKLSVCRRFNADLAATVTGQASAAKLIKRAEDENLLIYRVESDDRSPWFRFHPLLGEFLAARLSRHAKPSIDELHRRASHWFAAHELLIEAVRHATLGEDLAFAVEVIGRAAPTRWSLGYISPMLQLLERLPAEALYSHPSLFFLGCLTYALTARPHQAERWLAQIRDSSAAKLPAISSRLAFADAAVALQRDDSKRVIDLLEPLGEVSREDRFLHYVYLICLASAYATVGRFADARKLLADHPVPPEDARYDIALITEGVNQIWLPLTEGRVAEAASRGVAIMARTESLHGRRSVSANLNASCLGDVFYELDRIDEAREVLANRKSTLRASSPDVMLRAALVQARMELLQVTPAAACEFLEGHAAHYQSLGLDRPQAAMLAEWLRVLLMMGERAKAAELQRRLDELAGRHTQAEGFRAEIPVIAAVARSRLALVEANPAEALAALAFARAYAERMGHGRLQVQVDILAALVHDYFRQASDAAACLCKALQSGVHLGLIRTFLDEGRRVGELIEQLPLEDASAEYRQDLLERFAGPAHALPGHKLSPAPSAAKEGVTLTPRELQILDLIAKAMSSKRIAATLAITPETVKWNIRNILAKLGLSSRYDALTWARKQGLIE